MTNYNYSETEIIAVINLDKLGRYSRLTFKTRTNLNFLTSNLILTKHPAFLEKLANYERQSNCNYGLVSKKVHVLRELPNEYYPRLLLDLSTDETRDDWEQMKRQRRSSSGQEKYRRIKSEVKERESETKRRRETERREVRYFGASNSAPMKTGAKCFDIYRLPLLPDRFANGSRWPAAWGAEERKDGGRRGGTRMGYIFWREANDNGHRNDLVGGTHEEPYDSISPYPVARWGCSTSSLNRQKYWSRRPVRKQLFFVHGQVWPRSSGITVPIVFPEPSRTIGWTVARKRVAGRNLRPGPAENYAAFTSRAAEELSSRS